MKKMLMKKLRSRAGESIAETLVATLLASISLLMLAGMIAASTRLVARSRSVLDDYYQDTNRIAAHTEANAEAPEATKGPLSVTVKSETVGTTFGSESHNNVRYYENTTLSGTPVISYALPTATPVPEP